jgi:hypothetical protein
LEFAVDGILSLFAADGSDDDWRSSTQLLAIVEAWHAGELIAHLAGRQVEIVELLLTLKFIYSLFIARA